MSRTIPVRLGETHNVAWTVQSRPQPYTVENDHDKYASVPTHYALSRRTIRKECICPDTTCEGGKNSHKPASVSADDTLTWKPIIQVRIGLAHVAGTLVRFTRQRPARIGLASSHVRPNALTNEARPHWSGIPLSYARTPHSTTKILQSIVSFARTL